MTPAPSTDAGRTAQPSPRSGVSAARIAPAELRALRRSLLRWYDAHRRTLPWREQPTPYRVWLSEVMLQQTRVETVIPYFERFLRAFPDVAALAAAPLQDVLKLWQGLGYYRRARQLHAAAQQIMSQDGGVLPTTADEWRKLPGIGRYTAAAIASICTQQRVAVLDGNVKRVLARWHDLRAPIDRPATVTQLWATAETLVDPRRPGDFNQAMMELGATVCTPRRPRCEACPWRPRCRAVLAGTQAILPRKSSQRAAPRATAVAVAITQRGRWLLLQRPPEGLLGGLWELPGSVWSLSNGSEQPRSARGKRLPAATPDSAASGGAGDSDADVRALALDVAGISIDGVIELGMVRHVFTHRDLHVRVLAARRRAGRVLLRRHVAAKWLRLDEFESVPLARLDQKILSLVAEAARRQTVP